MKKKILMMILLSAPLFSCELAEGQNGPNGDMHMYDNQPVYVRSSSVHLLDSSIVVEIGDQIFVTQRLLLDRGGLCVLSHDLCLLPNPMNPDNNCHCPDCLNDMAHESKGKKKGFDEATTGSDSGGFSDESTGYGSNDKHTHDGNGPWGYVLGPRD